MMSSSEENIVLEEEAGEESATVATFVIPAGTSTFNANAFVNVSDNNPFSPSRKKEEIASSQSTDVLDHIPLESYNDDLQPFPTPFDGEWDYGDGVDPYTLKEINIMNIMGAIKDKVNWINKIQNPTILEKWKKELLEGGTIEHISQLEYAINELQDIAAKTKKNTVATTAIPAAVDGVYQSDNCIDEELRKELLEEIRPLEEVNDEKKDWHPGSNEQVLDLIHPSLYCYVKGVTKEIVSPSKNDGSNNEERMNPLTLRNFIGRGCITEREIKEDDHDTSEKFQWLPSDVSVNENGQCKFDSYINNLHPIKHKKLYRTLEKILSRMLPLFASVLTSLKYPKPRRDEADMYNLYSDSNEPTLDDYEDKNEYYEAYDEWYENRIPNVDPKVRPYDEKNNQTEISNMINLNGRTLQIIVKLASICLKRVDDDDKENNKKGKYDGGVWHVEGMKNESIVASGIYYLQSENITESRLSFRTNVCEPDYEQNDDPGVSAVYGLENEGPLVQNLGSVTCRQGRAVAWPNTYQHKVQPFELNSTESSTSIGDGGVRKILVFFLVDPAIRIVSTSIVPPQQQEWMEEEMKARKSLPMILPPEVQHLIVEKMDWHFTHDMAIEYRKELMKERKYLIDINTEEKFERLFSLCEH